MNKKTFKDIEQLEQIAQDVLQLAQKKGASAAEVHADIDDGFTVNVRMGDVETIEYHRGDTIGLTVYFGKRKGSVTTSDPSKMALEGAVNAACKIAKFTEFDPYSGLAEADLMAQNIPDLGLFYPWAIDTEQAIKIALKCESYAMNLNRRIKNTEGVSITTQNDFSVYGNSHGFIGATPCTKHNISCVLLAEENGQKERDYSFTIARDPADLASIEHIATEAVERTIRRLGSRRVKTQKAPVIMEAEVAWSLFANFIAAISGGNLYRKSSFLLDSLSKKIFADHIHIYEDPFLLKALGSAAFDTEGVATQNKDFIKDGVLQSYVLNSYAARKLGMQTTGNAGGVHNCFIKNGELSKAELLKKMDRGLLVTELIGQGVNLVTGDYSRGAVGFWVENGQIQFPVAEVTIAGNLRDMFLNLVTVANDVDNRGSIKTGSVLLEEMTIAGN
jgi:PmbA protein